tara:strand:+ start:518 stop:676 length:159 start_codon:yes stop_codon:yes gene_type:complete
MQDLYDDYLLEKAESGSHDFPSFEEWSGVKNTRQISQDKWQEIFDNDEQDLH